MDFPQERCDMKIPFSPPDISKLGVQEVAQALQSGWITTAPRTKQLENNIVSYTGAAGCPSKGSV